MLVILIPKPVCIV